MKHDDNVSDLTEQYRHERARARCQPIANLTTRKSEYWKEAAQASIPIGFCALLEIAACVAAVKFGGANWATCALVCAIILAGPIYMFWPDYPTEEDVERDRALRCAHGLPDNVEQD